MAWAEIVFQEIVTVDIGEARAHYLASYDSFFILACPNVIALWGL
jgi:hypothetical protein